MRITCYQCDTPTDVEVPFPVKQFVCSNCFSIYKATETGDFTFKDKYKYDKQIGGLALGLKGTLEEEEYTVTGVVVKEYMNYYWKEYVLASTTGKFLYLSEVSGHWILLREIPDDFAKGHPKIIDYNDKVFKLYDIARPRIAAAAGFFDIDLPTGLITMAELIAPPYMISFEKLEKEERTVFLGEHISKNQIKRIFKPTKELPNRIGIGLVQPYFFNVRQLALILCSVTLLILLTHLYVYHDKQEEVVFSNDISFSEYNDKEYISPAFTLNGGASPLTISVHSGVDNSWANAQVALVNEDTNEEIYANKDVEYYHGYSEGESWTEGDQSDDFSICGIGAGKYHLAITVVKAPEDLNNTGMKVTATWNKASYWNIWMLVIIMAVIVLIAYFGELYNEIKRWEDSPYTPYE
ncbi:DUF4178 domain-containing protein [Flavobacterium sp.]|uniref:DUF4178 domain-containing protein n=1 Tax=Flavobacterium sp. TaxID=239 RepID=UPI00263774B4|nr:DUF4178 domain-containing protein [Flavobacterium sp.]